MYTGMILHVLREMSSDRASEIFRKAMAEVGKLSAHTLKKELNLQNTFEDAVNLDHWFKSFEYYYFS